MVCVEIEGKKCPQKRGMGPAPGTAILGHKAMQGNPPLSEKKKKSKVIKRKF